MEKGLQAENLKKEKREFAKQAAIALLRAGHLPNYVCSVKALEYTEEFFEELNKKY
jgi:hypothetical protein